MCCYRSYLAVRRRPGPTPSSPPPPPPSLALPLPPLPSAPTCLQSCLPTFSSSTIATQSSPEPRSPHAASIAHFLGIAPLVLPLRSLDFVNPPPTLSPFSRFPTPVGKMAANKSSAVADQEPIEVLFALHPKFDLLDFAGPLEVITTAAHDFKDDCTLCPAALHPFLCSSSPLTPCPPPL